MGGAKSKVTIDSKWKLQTSADQKHVHVYQEPNGIIFAGKCFILYRSPSDIPNEYNVIQGGLELQNAMQNFEFLKPLDNLSQISFEQMMRIHNLHVTQVADNLGQIIVRAKFASLLRETIITNVVGVDQVDAHRNTLLHFAASVDGDIECINTLIACSANIEAANQSGNTALQEAIRHNMYEHANVLLTQRANVHAANSQSLQALHLAAQRGSAKICELLIQYGANANSVTEDGCTALHLAAQSSIQCVSILLHHSPALTHVRNKAGESAIHLAAGAANCADSFAILRALHQHNADVNSKVASTLWTPLMYAARHNAHISVTYLLSNNARVDDVDVDGNTALHLAAKYKQRVSLSTLCRVADVNTIPLYQANHDGKTASDYVQDDDACTRCLLEAEVRLLKAQLGVTATSQLGSKLNKMEQQERKQLDSTSSNSSNSVIEGKSPMVVILEQQIALLQTENSEMKSRLQHIQQDSKSQSNDNNALQCAICLSNNVNTAFIPCGHACCCDTCAQSFQECPFCRKQINNKLRLFGFNE